MTPVEYRADSTAQHSSHGSPHLALTRALSQLGIAALLGLGLTACVVDDASDAPHGQTDDIDEIVSNLQQAGFPAAEIEILDDGVVMVGGDAAVSLQASREMVGDIAGKGEHGADAHDHGHAGALKQYRTNNTIADWVANICVNGAAYTGDLSTALDTAIARYNALPLSFQFTRTSGSTTGCDAVITGYTMGGTGGQAGFPANGVPYGAIYMGTAIAPTYGVAAATHVVSHELGHTIGFRHTDYYHRAISCGSGGNEGDAGYGAVHIPNTPTTAVYNGSVMNSCYNSGSTGVFTASDNTALSELYGLREKSTSLWETAFNNTYGWASADHHWATIQHADVNGDGKDDVCGRGAGGIHCALSNGSGFGSAPVWSDAFSNANGWHASASYWGTIRFPDVNGDGKADVCGRGYGGIACALSNGSSFNATSMWTTDYSNPAGWSAGEYYWGTIQYADINGDGKADVCGRGGSGIMCAVSTGSSFSAPSMWSTSFSNAHDWHTQEYYWGTIRLADVNGDGKADVCGRGSGGVSCAVSNGTSFNAATDWTTDYSNAQGWGSHPSYWGTLEFPDVDGDGNADLCGRGAAGIFCSISTGSSFGTATLFSNSDSFSNAHGWHVTENHWGTIEFPDLNDDGRADVCGRAAGGMVCMQSSGSKFGAAFTMASTYSNTNGWDGSPSHWATIRFPDLDGDGRADVCGRAGAGMYCGI